MKTFETENKETKGQMTWAPDRNGSCGVLHLRLKHYEHWQPYTAFPEYYLDDPSWVSKGYMTFLTLLDQKWQLL